MRVREAEAYASKAGAEVDGRNPSRAASGAETRTATGGETKPEAAQGLLEAALERSNMMRAYQRVVENKGAPGVDGLTVLELKPWLVTHWAKIKQALLAGEYMPTAVRKVEIPKPQGGVRILGIPTIKPGPTRTAMTAAMPKSEKFADVDSVAESIVSAIDKHKDVLYVPFQWQPIMFVIRSIPERIFKKLNL